MLNASARVAKRIEAAGESLLIGSFCDNRGRRSPRAPILAVAGCMPVGPLDKTRTPLRVWLAAAWYLTNQKQGANALGLQRVLGLGSYQTAWTMLHRFRKAMVRPGREQLHGKVEVDETYLAITDRERPKSAKGRKNQTSKTLIAIAVEILEPKGFGRIRVQRIPDRLHPDDPFRAGGGGAGKRGAHRRIGRLSAPQ